MFQSSIRYLGNVWHFQHIKEIIKISQDQLDILNNIPGWSRSYSDPPITTSGINFDTHKPTLKTQTPVNEIVEASSKLDLINSKETEISNNILSSQSEELCNLEINCKKFLSKKSASLSSVDEVKPLSSFKRSISVPNLKEDPSQVHLSSEISDVRNRTRSPEMPGSNIEVLKNNDVSIFTDSAVQCQMSQSSQPNFNLSLNSRVALAHKSPSCETEVEKEPIVKKVDKIKLQTKLDMLNAEAMEKAKLKSTTAAENVSLEKQYSEKEKLRNVDESFVSQPIPCAQPESNQSAVLPSKDSLSLNEKTIPTVPVDAILDTVQKKNCGSSKRKHKSKQEKISKKFRGMYDVNIFYSSEQIKNMITVMKTLNDL